MLVTFPTLLTIDELRANNRIRQVAERNPQKMGALASFERGRTKGFLFKSDEANEEVLILPKSAKPPDNYVHVVQATKVEEGNVDFSSGAWIRHPLRNSGAVGNRAQLLIEAFESWANAFSFTGEDPDAGIPGLRTAQLGAVHSVHAHWSKTDAPATIVMPTGTGKTDTMLSILVSVRCSKLLVVVPTDALRTQIAEKFLTLGILRSPHCAVLLPRAKYPVVGMLQHVPKSAAEVDEVFSNAQVVVATSSIAGQCATAIQERMAKHCPYLFIDEAHHAEAPTWIAFKEQFRDRRILQFTATPFREDGKPLDGEIIFKYPLRKAQEEGYFKKINFQRVVEFNPSRSDRKIAEKAIQQLRADLDKGHILMARVDSVARAKEVFPLYGEHSEFNPVQLHTGIKSQGLREKIRRQITDGKSRIVVCVDMLGEGFDLPELKIAAFHDIRKTLAVTLQLAGRFTRARPDLGDATFIANTADVDVKDELRKLYARDPDWNFLLPEISDQVIGEQLTLQEFLKGFTPFTKEIPLRTVRPALSTIVYRTRCTSWTPDNFKEGIPSIGTCEQIHSAINQVQHTLVIVLARRVPLPWTDVESLVNWDWELYVVVWSPEQNLLFINSSSNAGEYRQLAEAIAGVDSTLIRGQEVFRAFAGVNRLLLQNVGLSEQLGRNVRYIARMGADVEPSVSEIQRRRTTKSVLAGTGYEHGEKVTIGASRKGRIWSHQRDRVHKLADWCRRIGAKLLDEDIDPNEVLAGTLESSTLAVRPSKMPIAIDWPEEMYRTFEASWHIKIGAREWPLSEVSIDLVSPATEGPLRFAISTETISVELDLELFERDDIRNYTLAARGRVPLQIRYGGAAAGRDLVDFFYGDPPVIWFADGSSLEGNLYVELKNTHPPYDSAKIEAWDWSGVNIRVESQGNEKKPSSIQARVIRELKRRDYILIVDDDGSGEAADIVTARIRGEGPAAAIDVEFYHCKYSKGDAPGKRIEDLYEVCGQAQKCISWMISVEKLTDLFTHLLRRDAQRMDRGESTRIEVGDTELLLSLRDMSRTCPVTLRVHVVQPGLSKMSATRDQLQLLSVTEHHLRETYQLPFGVIASP